MTCSGGCLSIVYSMLHLTDSASQVPMMRVTLFWNHFQKINMLLLLSYAILPADIDECVAHSPCHVRASCTNTLGSFVCACNTGYSGDGTTCNGRCLDIASVRTTIDPALGVRGGGAGPTTWLPCQPFMNAQLLMEWGSCRPSLPSTWVPLWQHKTGAVLTSSLNVPEVGAANCVAYIWNSVKFSWFCVFMCMHICTQWLLIDCILLS